MSEVIEYMNRYQDNFELWAKEVLGMSLSEDQKKVADEFINNRFVAAKSGTGCGKALSVTEKVLTPKGFVTNGSLKSGDFVIGSDGKPTEVIGVYPQGEMDIYKVSFSDGSFCEATLDHLWATKSANERKHKKDYSVKTTEEIMNSLVGNDGRKNHSIPITKPVEFESKPVPIDPYSLGVFLGDGGFTRSSIMVSNSNEEIINHLLNNGFVLNKCGNIDYRVISDKLRLSLKSWGLYGKHSYNKFVPDQYKYNSIDVRLSILNGLMDTDGTLNYESGKSPYFTTSSEKLKDDVIFLVESLGGVTKVKTKEKPKYSYKGEIRTGRKSYNVYINLPEGMLPFRYTKKAKAFKPYTKYFPARYIVNVEYLRRGFAQCIKVKADNSLYLTNRFIVTHNTALAATKALWFFTTRPEAKVVCTAPTGHQLEDLLFSEIESWVRRIKIDFIKKSIKIIKGKIYIEGYKDWFIVGRTIPKDSNDKLGDVLAGFHAPSLLFLVDEASAVPDQVYSGVEGSMLQKNVYCLLVGNPTRANGYFYDCFHKNKSQWAQVTLSSERSPFNDPTYIERMKTIHGEESDWFRTKCLGEFPRGGGQVVANYDQIEEANNRWRDSKPEDHEGIMVAGLDPSAGRNDNSILTFRKGAYIFPPERISHTDGPSLILKVIARMKTMKAKELYIDYTGLGIILYDLFKRAKKPFKVYKVVSNARANNPEAYKNLRAELYKELSDNFDELYLPYHERYVQELPEIYFLEDKQPMQVVDKPKLKSRLKFSPDFSDSLMVSTYRHFNLGVTADNPCDTMAFTLMNEQLTSESAFAKI